MTDKCYACGESLEDDDIESVCYECDGAVYQTIEYKSWVCETIQFIVGKFVLDSKTQLDEDKKELQE